MECGEFSPLSAGDLSPSDGCGWTHSLRRWTRLCFADESAKRKSGGQVTALQIFVVRAW